VKRILVLASLAGLAGGLAEMGWVALYSVATPTNGMEVAAQVTATVISSAAAAPWAPAAGMGIHLLLSLVLGVAFVTALWRPLRNRSAHGVWAAALLFAVAIWAVNFLVILPALGSDLGALMPLGATLLSKTLFGVAMAAVLQRTVIRSPRQGHA